MSIRVIRAASAALAAIPFLLGVVSALAGDDDTKPKDESAYDIVVTTTLEDKSVADSPTSVTVITKEDIDRQEARLLGEVLRTVPGIDVVQSGSPGHTTSVFVRGTDINQMLVLLDGVPLTDPYFGGYDFASLSTEAVERIEIVRGPFSAIYGSDAIGGVVNIITRRGNEGFHLDAALEGGSDAYGRAQVGLGGGSDRLDYFVSGSWRDGDGTFANDDFREGTGLADVGFELAKDMRIGFSGRVTDLDIGIPFNGTSPSPWRSSSTEERVYSVPFTHRVSDRFDYALTLSHIDATYDYDDLGNPSFAYSSHTVTDADRASAQGSLTIGPNRVSFGASLEDLTADNEDNSAVNLDSVSNDSWGAFAQDSIAWHGFDVAIGVRYDDHDSYGSSVSPRANLSYGWGDADAGVKIKAGYGKAFRAPSAGELYFPGSGNLLLDPEESRSWEVGFGGHFWDGRLRADATYFDTKVKDLIDFEFTTYTFQNIGEASMKGVEVSFTGDLPKGFDVALSYTHLDAKDETTGLALKRRPDNRASLTLNYAWDEKLDVNGKLLWVDDRPDIDPDLFTDITTDGYTRFDLAASYRALDWLAPFVRVENAFDSDYAEAAGFPAPGRTFVGGVKLTVR
ncbi:MAG: TonB-dependent receptor [Acidobacteriota bacterium]